MVGIVERDEALWMSCRQEDSRGMIDPDDSIARRMHDEERFSHFRDPRLELLLAGIVNERLSNDKGPVRECQFGFAILFDARKRVLIKLVQDVTNIGRRADRRHGPNRGNIGRRDQNGRAA